MLTDMRHLIHFPLDELISLESHKGMEYFNFVMTENRIISSYLASYCRVKLSAAHKFGLSGTLLTNVELSSSISYIGQRTKHTYRTQASLQKTEDIHTEIVGIEKRKD